MTAPQLSPRLLAALGIESSDITKSADGFAAPVDRVDARYRDAIKAGATPLAPPATTNNLRAATIADPTTGTTLTIRSAIPPIG